MMKKILIIDDDPTVRKFFSVVLLREGYSVFEAENGLLALEMVERIEPSLILTDHQMPEMTGLELISELYKRGSSIPIIMLTGHGDISLTIRSIQEGAFDFLEKPASATTIIESVERALLSMEESELLPSLENLERDLASNNLANLLVGKSYKMKELFKKVGVISTNREGLLIEGESGSGKSSIAKLLHLSGITNEEPFIEINCTTIESCKRDLISIVEEKIESAGGGTLYLKEIDQSSHSLQSLLLKVMKSPLSCRVISSSSTNLYKLVDEGRFSEELYYKIRVFAITIPPLRERKEDINQLLIHNLNRLNLKLNKKITKIERGVVEILKNWSWPGNLIEFENSILEAVLISRNNILRKSDLLTNIEERPKGRADSRLSIKSLSEVERDHIDFVLKSLDWNKMESSKILEISRPTLDAKIERYKLKR